MSTNAHALRHELARAKDQVKALTEVNRVLRERCIRAADVLREPVENQVDEKSSRSEAIRILVLE